MITISPDRRINAKTTEIKVTARILYGTYSASMPTQQKATLSTALADRLLIHRGLQ